MSFELKNVRGYFAKQQSLAPYNSWRVGGKADYFYEPADRDDLIAFLPQVPKSIPIVWVGLGSNLLVSDAGYRGLVIATKGLKTITRVHESIVHAEAGVASAKLARYTARNHLEGIEFLAGIPGTVGGALCMNAGCFHGETWTNVIAVETINRLGKIQRRPSSDFQVGYRQVQGLAHDEWFIAGSFQLRLGEKQVALQRIRDLLDHRANTQPTSNYSCGSVFRNPDNDYAARLIEATGLKGKQIGGAQISEKHANFIINLKQATSEDINTLITLAQTHVRDKFGILLQPEVRRIG